MKKKTVKVARSVPVTLPLPETGVSKSWFFFVFQVQTEPGKGQDRPFGVSNVPPPRLPTAEEVENFPPDAKPVPRNPLPPFKV